VIGATVYAANAVSLVDLIAKGYGSLTCRFLAVYVLPLLTWGIWLLWRRPAHKRSVHERIDSFSRKS